MNAAARLVHQGVLSRQIAFAYTLSLRQMMLCLVALGVLASAFCMIYVTYETRMLHANYQRELLEQGTLHVQYGQFLLERSTLMMQGRVQAVALNQLDMVVPDHRSVEIIVEK